MMEGLTEEQRAVLQPPFATRLDRSLISFKQDEVEGAGGGGAGTEGELTVETESRNTMKKDWDAKTFGTKYF